MEGDAPFHDDFDGQGLDRTVWLPHYLPAWSSRADTAASLRLGDSCLTLDVPVDHPLWCAGEHSPPLRVSGIQSGNFSGAVGSTRGQQRFRPGQTVREAQARFEGWLPRHGRVAIRCRMSISPRSMAALWLSGFEDDPSQDECGELCVVEIFGRSVNGTSAEVGMGIKAFRDPQLSEDFEAPRLPIEIADFHEYAVDWDADEAIFSVDGEQVRRCLRPPTYPLQLMLAVFDFPDWSQGNDDHLVPELVIDWISG
jgi:hypothetical protein